MGEFFYFLIYVVQQLGVMLGVGAQTVLLCAHLIAVHHGDKENPHATYAEAARFALVIGLFFIVISGLFAVVVHLLSGQVDIVLSPPFLFKWALIIVLLAAFFLQSRLREWVNFYYAFTGTTWYALFLVHSLGPITSWGSLWVLYILWGILFALVWWGFVALMQRESKKPASTPAPAVAVVVKKEVPKPLPPPPKPIHPPPPPVVVPVPPPPPP